jgi:multidrug efflux pump subunit AcrA (membrane-fusion protein)
MNVYLKRKHLKKGILLVLGLLLLYLMLHACSKEHQIQLPLPKVQIQKPISKTMVEYVTQTGTLVAYNSVDLVARVQGYLEAIEFVDGSVV